MNIRLTDHFTLDEFRCPCCGQVNAAAATMLAKRLQPVRDVYGVMRIVSGFRCPKHNAAEGGKQFSQHLCGLAADIECTSDADRLELLSLLISNGFPRLGVGRSIIHADIGTITGPLLWVY